MQTNARRRNSSADMPATVSFGCEGTLIRPLPFIAECFENVGFPRRYWWMAPPIKFAAAAGLIAGLWVPHLGVVTTIALVLYFLIAIGMHVRARDFGRNLFLNATGMLLICAFALIVSFLTG